MHKENYKGKEIWTVEKVIAGEKKDTFWLIEDEDMSAAAIKTNSFPKNNAARVFVSMDKLKAFVDAEGSFITPEVIDERGAYHAAHAQCETDVMEAIVSAKTPVDSGDEDTL